MVLRPGNAGSNTAADPLTVLDRALTQVPDRWRSKKVLIRADGAGYSHALITALSEQQLEFSSATPSPTRSATRSGSSPSTPGKPPTTATDSSGGIHTPAAHPAPGLTASTTATQHPQRSRKARTPRPALRAAPVPDPPDARSTARPATPTETPGPVPRARWVLLAVDEGLQHRPAGRAALVATEPSLIVTSPTVDTRRCAQG